MLREQSEPIKKVSAEVRDLAEDMIVTMHENNGAGLAAQQIGRTESICVIDVRVRESDNDEDLSDAHGDVEMPLVLINPVITDRDGRQSGPEGCLSFPEIFVNISRAGEVTVEYMDLKNKKKTLCAHGLLARAIQHELDHLNGVLLVDQMSPVQKVAMAGKLKRLKKKGD